MIDRETSHPTASPEKTTNAPFLRDTTIPKLDYTNSVSQSGKVKSNRPVNFHSQNLGYYGPIHTIFGLPDQSEGDELRKSTSLQWQTRVDASQKGARPLHQLAVNSSDEANLLSHGSVASKITGKVR